MRRRLLDNERPQFERRRWVWGVEETLPGPAVRFWYAPGLTPAEAHSTAAYWRFFGLNVRAVRRLVRPSELDAE